MNLVENVLISDSKHNTVKVMDSPNYPDAGKGLLSDRKAAITKDTGMPYWGCVFVSMDKEIDMHQKFKERLVKLKFQPFSRLGITLYLAGSLSCAAGYANDANFNNWKRILTKTTQTIRTCTHVGVYSS